MLFEVNVLKMALNVSWVVGKRDPKMSRIWMSEIKYHEWEDVSSL